MGGRLDSTNVIRTPEAAVITSIGLDHTKELGDTLEKIAGEKGGIIKTGGTVIVDGSNTAVMPVFEKSVRNRRAACYKRAGTDSECCVKSGGRGI